MEPTPCTCAHCRRVVRQDDTVKLQHLRRPLIDALHATAALPNKTDARICRACLYTARTTYVLERLTRQRGALSAIEAEVAQRASQHEVIAQNVDDAFDQTATLADRVADQVTRYGGSWSFLLFLSSVLIAWMTWNSTHASGFDPYPFILLNLVLSCIAAFQAPVILMSSNRQAARDRSKADQDFRVNLKAELEVASLHEKLDHLLHVQWEQLIELQELQVDMLRDLIAAQEDVEPPPAGTPLAVAPVTPPLEQE